MFLLTLSFMDMIFKNQLAYLYLSFAQDSWDSSKQVTEKPQICSPDSWGMILL